MPLSGGLGWILLCLASKRGRLWRGMIIRKQVTLINLRVSDAFKNCSLALICCVWAATISPAQSVNGRITGTIADQAGAVISNAVVTVTNEGTGAQRRVTADENGLYVAPELPVGFYTLK